MTARKNITGQVFGKLTAVSDTGKIARHSSIWLFQCECGVLEERNVRDIRSAIWNGSTPMCSKCKRDQSALTRRDITGQKFGKLTALRPTNQTENRSIVWESQCECGRLVYTANLRKGSCGKRPCNPIAPLPGNEGAFKDLYRDYRDSARKRGIDFALTPSQARELFEQKCFYCDAEPSYVKKGVQPFVFNGIDRLHNHLGYIEGNVVACCGVCNRAKGDLSYDEFMVWIDRVASYRARG